MEKIFNKQIDIYKVHIIYIKIIYIKFNTMEILKSLLIYFMTIIYIIKKYAKHN